jgi:hypothetical protein
MYAKAHASAVNNSKAQQGKRSLAELWTRFVSRLVMDGPDSWDVHPDVLRKIEQSRGK